MAGGTQNPCQSTPTSLIVGGGLYEVPDDVLLVIYQPEGIGPGLVSGFPAQLSGKLSQSWVGFVE